MIDESLGRKQLIGEALQAIQQMRLGVANRFINENGHVRFTIVMNRAECATPTRLKKMTQTIENCGFRAFASRISDATLVVECIRSRRESTVVQRIGRDHKGDGSYLVVGHGKGRVVFVDDHRATGKHGRNNAVLILTQKDDQIEIWYDQDQDDKPGRRISEFRNHAVADLICPEPD